MKGKLEILFKHGKVVDGTGNPWFQANVGVKDGFISTITRFDGVEAERIIDARGLVVAPGFVDIHSHSDFTLVTNHGAKNRLWQGITTDVVGNCGQSAYGFTSERRRKVSDWLSSMAGFGVEVDWNTLSQWRRMLENLGIGVNVAPFIGFGMVRSSILGDEGEGGERNAPTGEELGKMMSLVDAAMRDGAFGLTSGLEYAPQRNAYTEEVIELAKVAARYGGCYMSHLRSEDDYVVDAVKEFIRIVEEANIPGCISHHKACNPRVWGKSATTLKLIRDARSRGLEVICDTYPWLYVAVRNVGNFFLTSGEPLEDKRAELMRSLGGEASWPKLRQVTKAFYAEEAKQIEETRRRLKKHGTPGRIPWNPVTYYPITYSRSHPEFEGKNFTEAAKLMGVEDPWDAMRLVYMADDGTTRVALGSMSEKDLIAILSAPFTAVSTDAMAEDEPKSFHPRGYGTFPIVLEKYVREKPVLSLEDAIRKMTSLPTGFLGLKARGLIREGFWADVVVFDPETIHNNATYAEPALYPEGISYVMVNGKLAIDEEKYTGATNGRVLVRDNPY